MSIKIRQSGARRRLCAALAGALTAAALTAPALAADQAPCMTVRYRDLDLTTTTGATMLYRRINGAARSVCGERGYGLFFERQWDNCYRAAVADAVAAVNSPLLTNLHRHGHPGSNVTALAIW
jgi:UrcA family protein